MKKLIFTLALLFIVSLAHAAQQGLNIWAISSTTVSPGSSEWMDVKYETNFTGEAIVSLYSDVHGSVATVVSYTFAELEAMPKNGNGTTRLYFTIPNDAPIGSGAYKTNAAPFTTNITITSTTPIILPTDDMKQGTVSYYTNTGIFVTESRCGEMPNIKGGYVYHILYDDKTTSSGHIYFVD